MRHRKLSNRFHRSSMHRRVMFSNMAVSLIDSKSVETTLAKAKALRPCFEKIITVAKKGDNLTSRRYLLSRFSGKKSVIDSLFEMSKKYIDRPGGYLRIVKSGFRKGDAAPMAIVSLV